jgi:sRNA-binding carbon storage regulator CsrA
MLVITRNEEHPNTVITLPDGREIVVSILPLHKGAKVAKTRLGITAPRDIIVLREELLTPPKQTN